MERPQTNSAGSRFPLADGVIFHRVIRGFAVPGWRPARTGTGGRATKFADGFHPELQFDRPYLLAMADAGPGQNGSQFFITVANAVAHAC